MRIPAAWRRRFSGKVRYVLWVPRTSSTSRDQAVFADHATDASLPPNPVLIKIDRFGSGFSGAAACSER
jgi:hypothetical protein